MASPKQLRGLDWLFFFVADLQAGFGPFIAVYLTNHHWTQAQLGVALGVGTASAMIAQIPGGALVDRIPNKSTAALIGLTGIGLSAALMATSPDYWSVLLAQAVHGFASCMVNPALSALTLGLVSREAAAERLGRNGRYAAVGSAIGAALMGAIGTWVSPNAVFWLASAMCIPALTALMSLRRVQKRTRAAAAAGAEAAAPPAFAPETFTPALQPGARETLREALLDYRLFAYCACTMLFHLANAAMLPLVGVEITKRAGDDASLIIAACILVPQLLVALMAPFAGMGAQRWGRRVVLLVGFSALPARALLLAFVTEPWLIIPIQALDGLAGATFGVMTPLIAADLSSRGQHYNLRLGVLGLAMGIAATLSNTLAGWIAESLGTQTAFVALALAGFLAVLTVAVAMPETRPRPRARLSPA